MKEKITKEEWTAIAVKSREISDNLNELLELLSGKLPKEVYLNKWKTANKSFGILRSHLDEICNQKIDEVNVHFFGAIEKD